MSKIIEPIDEDKKKWLTPVKIILALFLVLLIVVMVFPEFSVKLDPEPKEIPTIEQVVSEDIEIIDDPMDPLSYSDFIHMIKPNDPVVKQTADKIASISCESSKICNAKAMFYFVRDNFDYVSDPTSFEYVKSARESLVVGVGDCDDASVLLANLLQAIGVETRLVFIPKHVFIQLRIENYKQGRWLSLDPTCKQCRFGELPYQDTKEILGIIQ